MRIADLDTETKAVSVMAHAVNRSPSIENLRRLRIALKKFDGKHEAEHTDNLIRAIFGTAEMDAEDAL